MEKDGMGLKNLILDCDGVLTDGSKIVDATGSRVLISFNTKDDQAVVRLRQFGINIAIVTQSDFEGIKKYWTRKGVIVIVSEDKTESVFDELGWAPAETVVVGDDLTDQKLLAAAMVGFVPMDAHPALKKSYTVIPRKGGKGIVQFLESSMLWSD